VPTFTRSCLRSIGLFLLEFSALSSCLYAQCVLSGGSGANEKNVVLILSQAAVEAAKLQDARSKATALQDIANALYVIGEKRSASQFYDCAMRAGAEVKLVEGREPIDDQFRIQLIGERADQGDVAGALANVNDLPIKSRDSAREELVGVLATQGQFGAVESILQSIEGIRERDSALSAIAGHAASQKHFDLAEREGRSVANPIERIQVLTNVAVRLAEDGQRGRATTVFSEAIDLAKQQPPDDEGRGTGGAPQFWTYKFSSRDTMLGYVATQQMQAGLDSAAEDTLVLIEDVPAHAHVRYLLANLKGAPSSAALRTESQGTGGVKEGPSELTPTDQVIMLATGGDYAGAVSIVSGLEQYERPYAFSEVARIEVERGDFHQAMHLAGGLAPEEKAPTLIAIAEALISLQNR
jgi:hypothetical protein